MNLLLRSFLAILFFFLILFGVSAADNNLNDESTDEDDLAVLYPPNTLRPRMSLIYEIECYYSSGHISLKVPEGIFYIDIDISMDDSSVWQGYVTDIDPSVSIPKLSGQYTITCKTNDNQVFQGLLYF